MKNKIARERVIYDNYDLWNTYPEEEMKALILEDYECDENEMEITDEMIMNMRYREDEFEWDSIKRELNNFFDNVNHILVTGQIGRWNEISSGFDVFDDFDKALQFMSEDCDYFKFYDENGHLYLTCSHHDGTCNFEIRILSDEGYEYLDRYNYSWNDKRKDSDVAKQLYKRYSKTPQFCHKIWGAKRYEYEPITKGRLIDKINNTAKSFYYA